MQDRRVLSGGGGRTSGQIIGDPQAPESVEAGKNPPKDSIREVSGRLLARKSVLDQIPSLARVPLPPLSGNVQEIARTLQSLPSIVGSINRHQTLIEPSPVKLPDGGADEHPVTDTPTSDASLRIAPLKGLQASSQPEENARRSPVFTDKATIPIVARRSAETGAGMPHPSERSGKEKPAEIRVNSPVVLPSSLEGMLGPHFLDETRGTPDSPSMDRPQPPSPSSREIRVGTQADSSFPKNLTNTLPGLASVTANPRLTETSLKASSEEERGFGSLTSSDGLASVTTPAGPPSSLIRNPLSSDLRNFSMASQDTSRSGDNPSPQDGIAAIHPEGLFAGATPQGGESGDLSKTNELLQQILDAVRKQRVASLPMGGPVVSPGR